MKKIIEQIHELDQKVDDQIKDLDDKFQKTIEEVNQLTKIFDQALKEIEDEHNNTGSIANLDIPLEAQIEKLRKLLPLNERSRSPQKRLAAPKKKRRKRAIRSK